MPYPPPVLPLDDLPDFDLRLRHIELLRHAHQPCQHVLVDIYLSLGAFGVIEAVVLLWVRVLEFTRSRTVRGIGSKVFGSAHSEGWLRPMQPPRLLLNPLPRDAQYWNNIASPAVPFCRVEAYARCSCALRRAPQSVPPALLRPHRPARYPLPLGNPRNGPA